MKRFVSVAVLLCVALVAIERCAALAFEVTLSDGLVDRPAPGRLLSDFHGREVVERAAVVLPDSYLHEPERRYPVVFSIPGFGGTHREALRRWNSAPKAGDGEVEFIRVALSGNCQWGHHCYA